MIRTVSSWARCALLGLSIALAACGAEYDRTEISAVRATLDGEINVQRILVNEGLVTTARVVAWNDDNEKLPLDIRSKRPDIVEVSGVVNEEVFSFLGLQQGQTEIEFVADGRPVLTVLATVLPQPAPSP